MSVDLLGQVAAESIGTRQFSAVGGQVDFVRGARFSQGGFSIIALFVVSTLLATSLRTFARWAWSAPMRRLIDG